MRWYRQMRSAPFDHPDPVHNPPAPDEIKALRLQTSGYRSA